MHNSEKLCRREAEVLWNHRCNILCAGRSVLDIALDLGGASLRCATVHLESPVPGALASAPRKAQLSQACLATRVSHTAM